MGLTVKRALPMGEYIFRQGDEVTHFYCLLSGEVEVVRKSGLFSEEVLNTLKAGEYFGENSLLEGSATRSVSVRCATPVEVLTLARDDFEAGFGANAACSATPSAALKRRPSGDEDELRARLISFIRMVSPQEHRTLANGDDVFRAGDAANKFHILHRGKLAVKGAKGQTGTATDELTFGELMPGQGFGEAALLSGKPVHSKRVTCVAEGGCEVVEILGSDFLRLVEKSRVVRTSFERLDQRRAAMNARTK